MKGFDENEFDYGSRMTLCGLFVVISDLAGAEYQSGTCSSASEDGLPSYFDALEGVFDDYRIDDFAAGDGLKYGLTPNQLNAMGDLAQALKAFDRDVEGKEPERAIFARPAWKTIVALAQRVSEMCEGWCEAKCQDSVDYQDAIRRREKHR